MSARRGPHDWDHSICRACGVEFLDTFYTMRGTVTAEGFGSCPKALIVNQWWEQSPAPASAAPSKKQSGRGCTCHVLYPRPAQPEAKAAEPGAKPARLKHNADTWHGTNIIGVALGVGPVQGYGAREYGHHHRDDWYLPI